MTQAEFALPASQRRPIAWRIGLALVALAMGGVQGLYQAVERMGLDLYQLAPLPFLRSYYQGLTVHGVLLAIVFTFSFANGFMALTTARGYERPLASTALLQASFWSLAVGTMLAGWAMLANQATVLFTFYPPLKAHPLFYLGLVLAVLSTWLTLANQLLTHHAWRREHAGERTPLLAYASIMTYIMWAIASLGIAIEVVVFILPWSLGWLAGTDPQLDRTLFWFTGHPIVYFWLLPVYVSWYLMVPQQVGGRLYSDPLARLVFILFLILSVPVGVHHQFTDPGIAPALKAVQSVLTFGVFFPSMVTAFSVIAALESGGRAAGGRGLFGWIPRLPWGDPSVAAQLLAMLVFTLGGATGLINASYTMNMVVHNTAFIVGHFHMTVGAAVTLSIMGICYWLVPYLTGQALWGRRLALTQAWLWAIAMLIFARGQISGGLEGMPRRTMIGVATYHPPEWYLSNLLTAVGGTLLVLSGLLFFLVVAGTLALAPPRAVVEIPVGAPRQGAIAAWPVLDRWGLWSWVTVALVLVSYAPVFLSLLPPHLVAPGFRVW